MKLGYLDESALGEYLAETFKVPYAPARAFNEISQEVLRVVPQAIASKHRVMPLSMVGKKLRVAMMNPRDLLVLDEMAFLTGLQVEAWVASESVLLDALKKYYQVPRPVRETIPLADRIEDEDAEVFRPPLPSPPVPDSHGSRPPVREEIGLDGRPLSAPSMPPRSSVPLPRQTELQAGDPPKRDRQSPGAWKSGAVRTLRTGNRLHRFCRRPPRSRTPPPDRGNIARCGPP